MTDFASFTKAVKVLVSWQVLNNFAYYSVVIMASWVSKGLYKQTKIKHAILTEGLKAQERKLS